MGAIPVRSGTYSWIAIGMIVTMVVGFHFTYFGPLARGAYPEVPPLVHVHGIMLLASAAALSAATFRIIGFTIGTTPALNMLGFFAPTIFIWWR